MTNQRSVNQGSDLPKGLARPAQRALTGAGYSRLAQLSRVSEVELMKLHGIGPKALDLLRQALAAKGLKFAYEKKNEEGKSK